MFEAKKQRSQTNMPGETYGVKMIGELKAKVHLSMLMTKEVMGALVQGPQLPTLLAGSILQAKLNCTTTLKKIIKYFLLVIFVLTGCP